MTRSTLIIKRELRAFFGTGARKRQKVATRRLKEHA